MIDVNKVLNTKKNLIFFMKLSFYIFILLLIFKQNIAVHVKERRNIPKRTTTWQRNPKWGLKTINKQH